MKKRLTFFLFVFITIDFIFPQSYNLTYFISKAKENSPLINKNINNNKINQLNLKAIQNLLFKPTINVGSNVMLAPIVSFDNHQTKFEIVSQQANSYFGYDLAISDGGQYQAYISINQPLFAKSIYKAYKQNSNILNEINNYQINFTEHQIERLVSHQYLLCLMYKQQMQITDSLLKTIKKQIYILNQLVKNGIYTQSDLLLMQIETKTYKQKYIDYLTKYNENIYNLNLLCGINDTSVVDLEQVKFEIKKEDSVKESFFLKKYELDSIKVVSEQTIFEQKYKPHISAFANAGLNATYIPTPNRFGLGIGLNIVWNIFDGHQKEIQKDISFIKLQNIQYEKQNFVAKYNVNKAKFLKQIKNIDAQIKLLTQQLNDYDKLINIYSIQLAHGQTSIMNYIIIIKKSYSKKQELLELKTKKQELINAYNYWNF